MKSIKTLLINPPVSIEQLYGRFAKGGSDIPPLSLCYIASYLLKFNKEVQILDSAKLRLSLEQILGQIKIQKPDIVGFHACTPYINTVQRLAESIKVHFPDILVIAGGPHFFGEPEIDYHLSSLDLIVIGEGEKTTVEIVDGLEKSEGKEAFLNTFAGKINGVVFKKADKIMQTSPRELIADIDTIPRPARHLLLPLNTYKVSAVQYKHEPSTGVLTSRGCPFRCTFCVCSLSRQKVRFHSIKYVIDEVDELIAKYGIRDITFIDDVLTIKKTRTLQLCAELTKRKDKLVWSCNIRVGLIDKETLRVMKDSGCWMVLVGIESANPQILENINKDMDLEKAIQISQWCKELGLHLHPNFIIGHPGETVATIDETINFARKLYSHFPLFTIMTPFPGTALWKDAAKYGTLTTSNFDDFTLGTEKPVFIPHGLTADILVKKRNEAYRKCYLNPAMIFRHLKSLKSPSDFKRYLKAGKIFFNLN